MGMETLLNMEIILSKILIKDNLNDITEKELFYKSTDTCSKQEDGAFVLKAKTSYDFTTYNNAFSLIKWKKYTSIDNLSLKVKAQGRFHINVLSYNSYNTSRRIVSSSFFSFMKPDQATVEIPVDVPCDLLSFEIITTTSTDLYDAYYASDVKKSHIKTPDLTVMTAIKDTYNSVSSNVFALSPFLDSSDHPLKVSWLIFDDENILDYDYPELPHIRIINDLKRDKNDYIQKMIRYVEDLKNKSSHYLILSDRVSVEKESMYKLFSFLSLIKDEYENIYLSSFIFDFFRKNRLITDIGSVDINNTDNLIRSECGIDIGDNRCNWYFTCIPADSIKTDTPLPFPFYKNGELQEAETNGKHITLNGISCSTKEATKNFSNFFELYTSDWEDFVVFNDGYILQDLVFPDDIYFSNIPDMFYRSERPVSFNEYGHIVLERNTFYDFSTYFNSLSIEKWKKYTNVNDIWLELDAIGKFRIELMGHYINDNGEIIKEWLGSHDYSLKQRRKITLPFPATLRSSVVTFQIHVFEKNVTIYKGNYSSNVDKSRITDRRITLATTTFQKESFMERNVKLLNESLFNDEEYRQSFNWIIVDNGRSLDTKALENKNIRIFYNKNSGGAGGFTRGIIEANKQKIKPSHILLMDDDVLFMPESFKRLYKLLSIIKPEYENHFVSGAMLEMDEKNIQHEDIGRTNSFGEHGPVKPRYDLNLWDSVILNEKIIPDDPHQYAGWWYCCIPASTARLDNLPLPVFIRGDDIEYSFRNKAKFITMNGICIWHKGFGNKFSAALEFYQVHRNDLILHSINRHVNDVNIIKRINNLFWEEIYKFNYKGASLLTDAIEDYLKGPDFIKSLDGEKCMKSKKKKDNGTGKI